MASETGNIEKAKERLAVLAKLCPRGCEEHEDLEKAIRGISDAHGGIKAAVSPERVNG